MISDSYLRIQLVIEFVIVVQVALRLLTIKDVGLGTNHVPLTGDLSKLVHVHAVRNFGLPSEDPWNHLLRQIVLVLSLKIMFLNDASSK